MAELVSGLESAGLQEVRVVARFDCFEGTSKEAITRKLGVRGVNVFARKRP